MRLVPVVACALLTVIAGDTGAALHLRAQERQEAAAAAAAAADDAWVEATWAIAIDVELARRPLQQALDLDLPETDADDGVRYDVFVHGAAQADLQVQLDRLAAVSVPRPRRQLHDGLVAHLRRMQEMATAMSAPEQPDDQFDSSADALLSASEAFRLSVARDVRDLPEDRTSPPQPTTRAGLLYAWTTACARAIDRVEDLALEEDQPVDTVRANLRTDADTLEQLVRDLLAVEPLASDLSRLENEVLVPLRGVQPSVQALRDLEVALGRRDPRALEEALVLLDRTAPALELVTRGLDGYGASTCASYFDPGLLLPGDGAEGSDELAT